MQDTISSIMYKKVKVFSYFFRAFVLVIPEFTVFGLAPILTNIFLIEPLLHLLAFSINGMFIISRRTRTLGSFGYLFNYIMLVLFLHATSWINNFLDFHFIIIFLGISMIYAYLYAKVINAIIAPSF